MTCLTTGPVTCRVRLDRGGYVPGEAINIWATIDNQSKVTVKGTRSTLTEVMSGWSCWSVIILGALLDYPVHHQEQSHGDGEQRTGRHQPREDQGGLYRWLEVRTTVRAAPPSNQPQRLSPHPDTIWRFCKSPQTTLDIYRWCHEMPPCRHLHNFSLSLLRVISKNQSSSNFRSCWQPILLGMRTGRWGGRTRQNTPLHCQYSDPGWMKRTCDNQNKGRIKNRTLELQITGNVKRIFIRQKILTTGISSLPITNWIISNSNKNSVKKSI